MFCPKCGSGITEEANFCPDCGAKLKFESAAGTQNQTHDPEALATETQETPDRKRASSLKKTIKHSLRLSHRAARTIVLTTLVLALGSSIAYAAFYVYQNVYLPSQQKQTSNEISDSGNSNRDYKIESKYIEVNVLDISTFIDANHKMERKTSRWNYDLLQNAGNSEATDKINSSIEKALQKSVKQAEDENADPVGCILDRSIKATKLTNKYVCFVDSITESNGADKVWRSTKGVFFDLESGDSISPSEALGISSKELAKKCKKAARIYMEKNPLSIGDSSWDKEALESLETGTQTDELGITSKYLQTEQGIVYLAEYLRYTHEYPYIVIDPSSNYFKAGDDVGESNQICLVPRSE